MNKYYLSKRKLDADWDAWIENNPHKHGWFLKVERFLFVYKVLEYGCN